MVSTFGCVQVFLSDLRLFDYALHLTGAYVAEAMDVTGLLGQLHDQLDDDSLSAPLSLN